MKYHFLTIAPLLACSTLFLAGCSADDNAFETPSTPGTVTNAGVVSQKNFSILASDIQPAVIDGTTGSFTKVDVDFTVYIGDRNNVVLTDPHTIMFEAEYGLIEPSCVTEEGNCTVTWAPIKRPETGGPGSDGFVTITAYTTGEEAFTDSNGNNVFDDGDTTFDDLEEPFVDADEVWGVTSNGFSAGDTIIDVVSTNDPTGVNLMHDIADGFYNGQNCTHTSMCGTAKSITIFDSNTISIISNAALSRTIGGTVAGLTGSGLILQNNGADNLPITTNGPYTFATTVDDGLAYAVTVSTQPTSPGQICTVANASNTVAANVTNADVTCATNTFTIGGTVTGIPVAENIVIRNNGGDDLVINGDGAFVFATAIADGATYSVTVPTPPASAPNCTFAGTNTGTVSNANVINVAVTCIP